MHNRLLGVLVACAAFLCASTLAHAQIQAFIMPDSGFLRVDGQVTINPAGPQFSLRLFPGAQVTVLWTEGIEDYSIDRGFLGTVVTVRLREYGSARELHLAYEGFLALQNDPLTLGRDSLWFPEFSIPVEVSQFFIQHPDDWHLYQPQDSYPVLVLSTQSDLDINKVQIVKEPIAPAEPPPFPDEEAPSPEPAQTELAQIEPMQVEPAQAESIPEPPAAEPIPSAEPPAPPISLAVRSDGPAGELSNLIVRWDEAVSARNVDFLTAHIGAELRKQGLVDYLKNIPSAVLPLESQITNLEITERDGTLTTIMISGGQPLYDAFMVWIKIADGWELQRFTMHPHQPAAPQGLIDSIKGYVRELQEAAAVDREVIEELLGLPEPAQRAIAVSLFQGLNKEEPWQVIVTNPREFRATILVRHSPRTDVAIDLELAAEPTGWRVASFHAYPIN